MIEGIEKLDAREAALSTPAGHRQRPTLLRANGPEDGVELLLQVGDGHVLAGAGVEPDFDAHIDDALDLSVEHIARRAVAGDAVAHHAAKLLGSLEDRHAVTSAAQEVGR